MHGRVRPTDNPKILFRVSHKKGSLRYWLTEIVTKMKHTYPEDDDSIENSSRQFLKDTAAMDLMNYTLPLLLPERVDPLLSDQIFEKLVRRWHMRRLPKITAEGNFEMIVCPYCCEKVTLGSCRIDHVIPWGKLVLYRVIKELYQLVDVEDQVDKDQGKFKLSDKTKSENVFKKIDDNIKEYNGIRTYKSKSMAREEGFPSDVLPAFDKIEWEKLINEAYTDEKNLLLCCHRCNAQKGNALISSGHLSQYLTLLSTAAADGKIKADSATLITEKIGFITEELNKIHSLHHALLAFVEGDLNGLKLLVSIKKDSPEIPLPKVDKYENILKKRKVDAPVNEFRIKFNSNIEWVVCRLDLHKWQDGIVALFLAEHSHKISELLKLRPKNTDGEKTISDKRQWDEILSDFISKHPKASKVKEFRAKLEPVDAVDFLSRYARAVSERVPQKLRLINTQLVESGPHVLHGRICFYCFGIYEDFTFEIDHIKPVLRDHGFINATSVDKLKAQNYIPVCKTCNATKNSIKLSVPLLQLLMLKRWLDVHAPGLEDASYLSETDECEEIESVFSAEIKKVIAVTRNKILLLKQAPADEVSLMDNSINGDLEF